MSKQLNVNCHKSHPIPICGNYTKHVENWCPFTLNVKNNNHTREILDKIISRNGQWIGGEYENAHIRIHLGCQNGHEW